VRSFVVEGKLGGMVDLAQDVVQGLHYQVVVDTRLPVFPLYSASLDVVTPSQVFQVHLLQDLFQVLVRRPLCDRILPLQVGQQFVMNEVVNDRDHF
jgi:hypothetical protein